MAMVPDEVVIAAHEEWWYHNVCMNCDHHRPECLESGRLVDCMAEMDATTRQEMEAAVQAEMEAVA